MLEVEIIRLARQMDSDALGKIYMEYKDDLYFYALKMVKDSSLAEDIVQDTTVEMFKSIKNLQNDEYLKSWLIGICHNLCKKHFRTDKTVYNVSIDDDLSYIEEIPDKNDGFSPESIVEAHDLKSNMNSLIDGLPETQKATLVMYYYNELSVSEIAESMGCPVGTVKSNLNYARKKVKTSVDEYEKKHHCKLHGFAFAPFLGWVWKGTSVFKTAGIVYKSACAVAGITASTAVAATTTATVTTATKIIAGVVAATTIVTGGTVAIVKLNNNDKPVANTSVVQKTDYTTKSTIYIRGDESTSTAVITTDLSTNETEQTSVSVADEQETSALLETDKTRESTEATTSTTATTTTTSRVRKTNTAIYYADGEVDENTLTSLKNYNGEAIVRLEIGSKVKVISDYAFENCRQLSNVSIGSGVTTIGEFAFSGCTSLTSITIPSNVKTICYSAFEGCSNLKSVKILNKNCVIEEDAFDDMSIISYN